MIDLKLIREQGAFVKTSALAKNIEVDLDRVLDLDRQNRALTQEIEDIAAQKNAASKEIAAAQEADRQSKILEMRDLTEREKTLREKKTPIEEELQDLLHKIPNPALPDVPVGKDESENVVIKVVGEPTAFDFTPKDHIELGKALNIIDADKAADVTGARFVYLKNGAALLQLAIVQFVVKALTSEKVLAQIITDAGLSVSSKPFEFVIPPVMIKPDVYRRMARLDAENENERYYLQKDNLYLIGSAEHTLGPLHMDELLDRETLPRRYLGYSPAFRREAGSYGKDTRGIIRQHQFDKLEMESFTDKESSLEEQNFFVAIQEYLLQQLNLPYRVMMVCTGDMGTPDARQIDIETWMPTQETYRETHTADLMTDYQARRLNARYRTADGTEYLHMNDATAFAIGRILVAILENNQQADGTVRVPEVLVPYFGSDTLS